jgi:signal peptidase II
VQKTPVALGIACIVAVIDQLTKKLIDTYVTKNTDVIELLPFLNFVNIRNRGAAFGIFADMGNVFFIPVSLIAIIIIVVYLFKLTVSSEKLAFSLILGGAVGNLLDRIVHGSVIDFIDFHIGNWHWPAFNVADSVLTIGIGIFLLANLKDIVTKKSSSHASHIF